MLIHETSMKPRNPGMRTKHQNTFILFIIIFFLISSGCQLSAKIPLVIENTPDISTPVNPISEFKQEPNNLIIPDTGLLEDTLVSLYKQVSPGVVAIQVFSGSVSGQGSGFVIDKQGHILTNYHVIENAEQVEVDFISGIKTYGKIIGKDLDSDLAIIKVEIDAENLFPLVLGDSDNAKVGQTVVAIGNPYGLSSTMTLGIISARGRLMDSFRVAEGGSFFTAADLIQTDASINPGNSGGPLINLNGEVIGVNRAIQTSGVTLTGDPVNTGIGFAISSNIVRRVVPSLISSGSYDYPYLGLSSLNSLNLRYQDSLNLPQSTGAYVTSIVANGPADEGGLIAGTKPTDIPGILAGGDLIIAVDDVSVKEFSDLLSYIMLNKSPGDQVKFTVIRNGEEIEITVVLGKRP